MNSCHVLWEYAQYVARVRKYVSEMPLEEAVERAITECIREGILAEFLEKNRAEVVKVSIFEYDKEKEEKKLRKAEYEYGREQSRENDREELKEEPKARVSIVRWNLKEAECEENTNSRANLWSDGQKSHMRLCMRVRLHTELKPNNYTESCMIDEADGWRGRNVWYLGRFVRYALKEVQ